MDPSVARIIDANANRAREALRVLEEFARFRLDDASLSEKIKSTRHALVDALGPDWPTQLVRARDTQGDVGREIDTPGEYMRADAADVARAASKRVTEALRAMEEYAKTEDVDRARGFERLRYRCYELEQAVAIRLDAKARFGQVRLYVLLTEALCVGGWHETAEAAIDGGAQAIQLREKSMTDAELLSRARALSGLCRSRGVLFIVNDRADIARLSDADGVHVGQGDIGIADARRIVGPGGIVGVSTRSIDQARQAMAQSPDYIAVGPMFASTTKPLDVVPGPTLATDVRAETGLPIVAVGGINAENAASVTGAGADTLCVCSAIIGQHDAKNAAREVREATGNDCDRALTNAR